MATLSPPLTLPIERTPPKPAPRTAPREPRRVRSRSMLVPGVLVILVGVLHALGWLFPGAWYVVWPAQCATIALAAARRPKNAFFCGIAIGVISISLSFYWGVAALETTFDAWPAIAWTVFAALVAFEALSFALFCWAVSVAAARGPGWMWIAPCACTAIEQWFPRVFRWKLAYSQLEVIPLLQIAELLGPTAIGFVMTAACAIPAALWLASRPQASPRDRRAALAFAFAAGALLAATLLFGFVRQRQWNAWCARQPKLKIALIQVDPAYVGADQKLRERSLAIHEQVDLICWPESSLGTYSDALADFRDPEQTLRMSRDSSDSLEPGKGLACHLLAGGKQYREAAGPDGPRAMTAFLISPAQEIVGRYRKRTLLPFGEYIPGQAWYPALRQWATLHEEAEAGSDPSPISTADRRRLGVVICYEDTLPSNSRQTVAAGAEALFSLIQGTAFENQLTLVQHQRLAALRAVENRRYLVRCSSTGISCVIDPTGQIVAELPPQCERTLLSEIALLRGRTFYNRIGDAFPIACALLGALCLFVRSKR